MEFVQSGGDQEEEYASGDMRGGGKKEGDVILLCYVLI